MVGKGLPKGTGWLQVPVAGHLGRFVGRQPQSGRRLHLEPATEDPKRKMWVQIVYVGSDPGIGRRSGK